MIRRLRKRFIRIATLAVTAVLLVLCLSVNIANYISVDSGLTNVLNVISDNRGTMPPMPYGQPPEGRPDGQLTKETPFSTRYFVLRYDGDGDLIKADLDKIAAVTEDDVGEYLSLALEHGYGYARGYKYRVVYNGEDRWMAIFLDDYQEMRSVREIALVSLAAMAGCVALVYVIVVLCSRRAIDPVVQASERQKQFITDASHELKTPITVIATSLKVLEMETGKQKWIDKAQTQTEKLTELVNSLVTLSRMDEEKTPLHFAPFAVSDAVRETAESFRDFAESNGHALRLEIAPELAFSGDEYAIRQLVSILLDNVVKYAAEGTGIAFSLEKTKKGVLLSSVNVSRTPLAPEELDKLFDRFYRADPARSGTGGFGIGLSIARSIAEGHKGGIRASLEDGKICFRAELRNMK